MSKMKKELVELQKNRGLTPLFSVNWVGLEPPISTP